MDPRPLKMSHGRQAGWAERGDEGEAERCWGWGGGGGTGGARRCGRWQGEAGLVGVQGDAAVSGRLRGDRLGPVPLMLVGGWCSGVGGLGIGLGNGVHPFVCAGTSSHALNQRQ